MKAISKAKAHQVYTDKNGKRIPGVTTVLGVLNKPALVAWANRIGLQGYNVNQYVDIMAEIGTCAHDVVNCLLSGREPDVSRYSEDIQNEAVSAVESFFTWGSDKDITVIASEVSLVSDKYRFGGTIDAILNINGTETLLDFKTSSGIYDSHLIQVVAYLALAKENGYNPKKVGVLRIGRKENEGIEEVYVDSIIPKAWDLFLHCRAIYDLQKEVKKGLKWTSNI
jgi:hypothetical protein